MRLLIVTPFLETKGGMERVVLKIAEEFKATIHCLNYEPEGTFEEFKKIEIQKHGNKTLSKLPLGRRVATAIEAGNYFYNTKFDDGGYDVINAQQTPSEWIRNKNPRVIWYCHTHNREAFDLYEWRMKRRNPISKLFFQASIDSFKRFEFKTVQNRIHIHK